MKTNVKKFWNCLKRGDMLIYERRVDNNEKYIAIVSHKTTEELTILLYDENMTKLVITVYDDAYKTFKQEYTRKYHITHVPSQ